MDRDLDRLLNTLGDLTQTTVSRLTGDRHLGAEIAEQVTGVGRVLTAGLESFTSQLPQVAETMFPGSTTSGAPTPSPASEPTSPASEYVPPAVFDPSETPAPTSAGPDASLGTPGPVPSPPAHLELEIEARVAGRDAALTPAEAERVLSQLGANLALSAGGGSLTLTSRLLDLDAPRVLASARLELVSGGEPEGFVFGGGGVGFVEGVGRVQVHISLLES